MGRKKWHHPRYAPLFIPRFTGQGASAGMDRAIEATTRKEGDGHLVRLPCRPLLIQ